MFFSFYNIVDADQKQQTLSYAALCTWSVAEKGVQRVHVFHHLFIPLLQRYYLPRVRHAQSLHRWRKVGRWAITLVVSWT